LDVGISERVGTARQGLAMEILSPSYGMGSGLVAILLPIVVDPDGWRMGWIILNGCLVDTAETFRWPFGLVALASMTASLFAQALKETGGISKGNGLKAFFNLW